MAEWLRREIRNLLGSPRAGSNPVRSEFFFSQNFDSFSVNNQLLDFEMSLVDVLGASFSAFSLEQFAFLGANESFDIYFTRQLREQTTPLICSHESADSVQPFSPFLTQFQIHYFRGINLCCQIYSTEKISAASKGFASRFCLDSSSSPRFASAEYSLRSLR